MAQFARCNWQWSRQFIALRNGARSHNRLATLIRRRSLEGFKRIAETWTQAVLRSTGGQVPWSARAAALGGFAL